MLLFKFFLILFKIKEKCMLLKTDRMITRKDNINQIKCYYAKN